MKKRTVKLTAILSALMFLMCACGKENKSDNNISSEPTESTTESTTENTTESTQDTTIAETTTKTVTAKPRNMDIYSYADISLGGKSFDCNYNENVQRFTEAVKLLEPVAVSDLIINDDIQDWELSLYSNDSAIDFKRQLTSQGWLIMDNDMNFYADSPELTKLIIDGVPQSDDYIVSPEKEYYFSISCDEPSTEEEYVNTAVACTDAWLTSLQSEDTDEYYRNKSFEIVVFEDGYSQKCNYLSCGMVNGKKEFVVEICFTAEDYGSNTFYDKYYQEGRYTEAGTYWSGQYICGRFRYSDGKCSLIDMATRDGSSGIQKGLNGISAGEYKNFYEFARREDYNEALEESFESKYNYTVSRNLTMTEDGKPINIDIYAHSSIDKETDDTYTAIWYERAYINKEGTYSTGLYFTDNRTGHMPDTLPKDFPLTFDNYDGDANPDFCCRYDSDDEGTFYTLKSIQTDGRIFNLSGRAFEGGIYIAGCTDPSPRLQRTDDIAYIGWKIDENNCYYPTDSNGNKTELPELNMYSDRYHLPNDLKMYSEDENKVTCFLWNNTDSVMTTDGTYSIEINDAGEWKTVKEGLTCESKTIQPREYAEISYDISALSERYHTTYRIVQKSGNITGYGKFCLSGEDIQNIEIIADDIYTGSNCGNFSIINHGFNEVDITSAHIQDGDKKYPFILTSSLTKYYFICENLPKKAGTYKLVINDTVESEIEIKDASNGFPAIDISSSLKDNTVILSIKSDTDCTLENIEVFMKTDHGLEYSTLAPNKISDYSVKKNQEFEITLKDQYSEIFDDESMKELYDFFKEYISEEDEVPTDLAELGITADTDFKTFKKIFNECFSFSPDNEYKAIISYTIDNTDYQQYISELF